ncbi:MAG: hypothetical protein ABJD11_17305 [Gemmatimonadota bacterium]
MGLQRWVPLLLIAVAGSACHIEDRTPAGSRRDDIAIRGVILDFYRGRSDGDTARYRSALWKSATWGPVARPGTATPEPLFLPIDSLPGYSGASSSGHDVQVLRIDLRQERDVAAAWVSYTEHTATNPGEGALVDHVLLKRIGTDWRIANLSTISDLEAPTP